MTLKGDFFYTLGLLLYSNTPSFILLLKSFYLGHGELGRLLCPFDISSSLWGLLSTSLLFGTVRCSRPILHISYPVLESAISAKILGSGHQACPLLLGYCRPSQKTELGNTCVCIIYVCMVISKYFYFYSSVFMLS